MRAYKMMAAAQTDELACCISNPIPSHISPFIPLLLSFALCFAFLSIMMSVCWILMRCCCAVCFLGWRSPEVISPGWQSVPISTMRLLTLATFRWVLKILIQCHFCSRELLCLVIVSLARVQLPFWWIAVGIDQSWNAMWQSNRYPCLSLVDSPALIIASFSWNVTLELVISSGELQYISLNYNHHALIIISHY